MMDMKDTNLNRYRQQGLTLLEVMIAVMVLSIGLVGVAALQMYGLQSNQSSYHRTVATYQAWDIADRIRSNPAGDYSSVSGLGTDPTCISDAAGCTTAQLVQHDTFEWNTNNSAVLPNGAGVVCTDSTPNDLACDGLGTMLAIKLNWSDDNAGGTTQFAMSLDP